MGRKVFISVLGTGFYNECSYADKQKVFRSAPTRFVQEATLDMLKAEKWSERDAVYIFTTRKACQENWDKTLRSRMRRVGAVDEACEYTRLERVLEGKHYAASVEKVDIPDGLNTDEMWQVFDIMFDKLETGDRLYIDLTHGFRYLPMMMLVLCQYASFMKRTSVCSLTYGNFEAMDRTRNEAPLMDLGALSLLQGLTMGAAEFLKFGKLGTLSGMSMQSVSAKKEKSLLQMLKDEANKWDESLSTCRGLELQQGAHVVKVQETLGKLKDRTLPSPVANLLSKMQTQVAGFGGDEAQNLKAAVEWCINYGMVQQGYTLCQESIVTLLCRHFRPLNPYADAEMDDGRKELAYRNYMSSVLGISQEASCDESKWRGDLLNHKSLTKSLLNNSHVAEIRASYGTLTACRNQINHAGFIAPKSSSELRANLKANAQRCLDATLALIGPECAAGSEGRVEKVLINLSNHPYSVWDEAQRKSAAAYGTCVDMAFPSVSPEMSGEELDVVVNDYLQAVVKYAAGHIVTVHVMGEMTFCFRLVAKLKERGIRCVASCAERNVVEMDDERIKSVYAFTRFREY